MVAPGVAVLEAHGLLLGVMTDLYVRLDYRQYKHLEEQLRNWEKVETSHTTVDGFYHKALRLDIGDLTLEIQGPAVKEPLRE